MQCNDTPTQPKIRQNELLLDYQSDENYYLFPYEQNAPDNMHILHQQPLTVFQDYAINETLNVQSPQDYVNTTRRNELHVSNVSPSFTSLPHSNSFASTFNRLDFPPEINAFPSSRTFQPAYSNIRTQTNTSLIPDARLPSQYDAFTQPYIPLEASPLNTQVLPFQHEYSTFSDNSLPVTRNMLLSPQNNQSVTNHIPELNDFHPTLSCFASPTGHFGIQNRDVEMLVTNNVPPSNSLTFDSNSPPPRQILPHSRNVLQPLEQIVLPESQLSSTFTQKITMSECSYAYNISNQQYSSKPNTQETVDIGKKSLVCDYCGKAFSGKTDFKIHTRIHTGEKPYVCKECGKKFSLRDSLKNHKLIHTGEKPHVCEKCGKKFSRIGNLKNHKLIHTGEKPYECITCSKRFNAKGTLTKHYIVHSDEMPYQCGTCGKRFNFKCNLERHYTVHSDEIPYQCETCGKRFNYEYNLKRHYKVHSDEKPYE